MLELKNVIIQNFKHSGKLNTRLPTAEKLVN